MKKAKAKENVKANAKAKVTYAPFEVPDYLDSEEAIAEYLSLAARDENPGVLLKALDDVAKARGMAEVAKASGLGRESLGGEGISSAMGEFPDQQGLIE